MPLQPPPEAGRTGRRRRQKGFNAGEVIIEHVSNTSLDHPLIHLPQRLRHRHVGDQARPDALDRRRDSVFGVTWLVRRYLSRIG